MAQETDLELVIGLREPESPDDEFVVLGVVEDEAAMTELRMLHDFDRTGFIPPTAWRAKLGYETTGFSDWIRLEDS